MRADSKEGNYANRKGKPIRVLLPASTIAFFSANASAFAHAFASATANASAFASATARAIASANANI